MSPKQIYLIQKCTQIAEEKINDEKLGEFTVSQNQTLLKETHKPINKTGISPKPDRSCLKVPMSN